MMAKQADKTAEPASAEAIARLADQGKDISAYFRSQGRMVMPSQPSGEDHLGSPLSFDSASTLTRSR